MALFGKKDEMKFKIGGMTCGNCQQKVADALRKVPGVKAANVDLAFHRATVTVDPEQATPAAIISAVHEVGYEATPIDEHTLGNA